MDARPTRYDKFLETIRGVTFVKKVYVERTRNQGKDEPDGRLKVTTRSGTFSFRIELKRSYIDRAAIHGLIAQATAGRPADKEALILFARYVPPPSAETLVEAGVNFVDQVGNIHLTGSDQYSWTSIGKRETKSPEQRTALSPSKVQLMFAIAANPRLASATVRQLAEVSHLTKSNVGYLRKQLIAEGALLNRRDGLHLAQTPELESRLVQGYRDVLRPRLVVNRFRAPDASLEEFLTRATAILEKRGVKWSLTGGWGAFRLQSFYKGRELAIFIENFDEGRLRDLKLLPDANGSIILLKAIGTPCFSKVIRGETIAHPWLLFAELMQSTDPRAIEAAEHLRGELFNES